MIASKNRYVWFSSFMTEPILKINRQATVLISSTLKTYTIPCAEKMTPFSSRRQL